MYSNNPLPLFEAALGGIALFLIGLKIMTEGIRGVSTSSVRSFIQHLTSNRIYTFILGIVISLIVKSPAASIIIIIAMYNAALFSVFQMLILFAGVIFGGSASLYIISNPYTIIPPFLLFSGVLLKIASKKRKFAAVGDILSGVGILFIALTLLEVSYKPFDKHPFYMLFDSFFYQNRFTSTIFGALISFLIQTPSALVSSLSEIVFSFKIPLGSAFFMIVGGIIVAVAAILPLLIHSKKNGFVIILTIIIPLLFSSIVTYIFFDFSAQNLNTNNLYSIFSKIELLITSLSSLIILGISGFIARHILNTGGASDFQKASGVAYLDKRVLSTPDIAIEQVKKEAKRMALVTTEMYNDVLFLFSNFDPRTAAKIDENEFLIDSMNHEITSYLSKLSTGYKNAIVKDNIYQLIYTVSALEHIGDRVIDILKTIKAKKEENCFFSEAAMNDIQLLFSYTSKQIAIVEDAISNQQWCTIADFNDSKRVFKDIYRQVRAAHLQRIADGSCTIRGSQYFNDIINSQLQIAELSWTIIESASGVIYD